MQPPTNTAVKKHLYTLDREGRKSYDLERRLGNIEGMAAPILARWHTVGATTTLEERSKISIFLASMHGRVPRAIESTKEVAFEIFMEDLRRLAADPSKIEDAWQRYLNALGERPPTLTFSEFETYLHDPLLPTRVHVNEKYALAMSIATCVATAPLFLSLNWSLRDAPQDSFFVTSDTPVNVFVRLPQGKAVFGGLEHPGVEIAFPLSPSLCLFLKRSPRLERSIVTQGFVREINRRMAAMAERFLISHVNSQPICDLVNEFAFTIARPRVNAAGLRELRKDIEDD